MMSVERLTTTKTKPSLDNLAHSARMIANAIAADVAPGKDAVGGHVQCLTEAVMGITAGLCKVADSLDGIADAIRETREQG
jgi:hypothetical protein